MALAVVDERNRPKAPVGGCKMQERRWLIVAAKVLYRNGILVGIEQVTGLAAISSAPYVRKRNAGRRADFDDFRE